MNNKHLFTYKSIVRRKIKYYATLRTKQRNISLNNKLNKIIFKRQNKILSYAAIVSFYLNSNLNNITNYKYCSLLENEFKFLI